jgi:hypothetical protein
MKLSTVQPAAPHASQPSAARSAATVATGKSTNYTNGHEWQDGALVAIHEDFMAFATGGFRDRFLTAGWLSDIKT